MILLFAIGYAIKLVCFRCIDALDVFSKNENFGDERFDRIFEDIDQTSSSVVFFFEV